MEVKDAEIAYFTDLMHVHVVSVCDHEYVCVICVCARTCVFVHLHFCVHVCVSMCIYVMCFKHVCLCALIYVMF